MDIGPTTVTARAPCSLERLFKGNLNPNSNDLIDRPCYNNADIDNGQSFSTNSFKIFPTDDNQYRFRDLITNQNLNSNPNPNHNTTNNPNNNSTTNPNEIHLDDTHFLTKLMEEMSSVVQHMNEYIDVYSTAHHHQIVVAKTVACRNELVSCLSFYQTFGNSTISSIPSIPTQFISPIMNHHNINISNDNDEKETEQSQNNNNHNLDTKSRQSSLQPTLVPNSQENSRQIQSSIQLQSDTQNSIPNQTQNQIEHNTPTTTALDNINNMKLKNDEFLFESENEYNDYNYDSNSYNYNYDLDFDFGFHSSIMPKQKFHLAKSQSQTPLDSGQHIAYQVIDRLFDSCEADSNSRSNSQSESQTQSDNPTPEPISTISCQHNQEWSQSSINTKSEFTTDSQTSPRSSQTSQHSSNSQVEGKEESPPQEEVVTTNNDDTSDDNHTKVKSSLNANAIPFSDSTCYLSATNAALCSMNSNMIKNNNNNHNNNADDQNQQESETSENKSESEIHTSTFGAISSDSTSTSTLTMTSLSTSNFNLNNINININNDCPSASISGSDNRTDKSTPLWSSIAKQSSIDHGLNLNLNLQQNTTNSNFNPNAKPFPLTLITRFDPNKINNTFVPQSQSQSQLQLQNQSPFSSTHSQTSLKSNSTSTTSTPCHTLVELPIQNIQNIRFTEHNNNNPISKPNELKMKDDPKLLSKFRSNHNSNSNFQSPSHNKWKLKPPSLQSSLSPTISLSPKKISQNSQNFQNSQNPSQHQQHLHDTYSNGSNNHINHINHSNKINNNNNTNNKNVYGKSGMSYRSFKHATSIPSVSASRPKYRLVTKTDEIEQQSNKTNYNNNNNNNNNPVNTTINTANKKKYIKKDGSMNNSSVNMNNSNNNGNNNSSKTRLKNYVDESRRIFVSNFPSSATDEQIRNVLSDCGAIEDTVWFPSKTDGKFYGSGLITFTTQEAARRALRYNRKILLGRIIRIELSMAKDPIKQKPKGCKTVYLNNVPANATENRIRNVFKRCGKVRNVRFHERDGIRTGGAFVEFYESRATEKALEMHGKVVDGYPLYVDFQRY